MLGAGSVALDGDVLDAIPGPDVAEDVLAAADRAEDGVDAVEVGLGREGVQL